MHPNRESLIYLGSAKEIINEALATAGGIDTNTKSWQKCWQENEKPASFWGELLKSNYCLDLHDESDAAQISSALSILSKPAT